MLHEILTRQFFDGEVLHGATRIVIDNGVVVSREETTKATDFFLISPGLVDIQMNGFGRNDVAVAQRESLSALDAELAKCGTTSWCGTIVTAPLERMSATLTSLHEIWSQGVIPGFCGVHIEGPFLGSVPGAHRPDWIVPIDHDWLSKLEPSVLMITMGAEQQSISAEIQYLRSRDIAVSLGHSRPTKQQFEEAIRAGAVMVTHLFNGMSGVHHRELGLALMALTNKDTAVGLIADMVHVSPEATALAFAAKGERGVCLVSDSIAWESPWAASRGIEIRDGAPRLPDGTLAGSSTPLAKCVAAVVQQCGVPLDDALRAATSTPADVVGISGIGRVTLGEPADLIAFDESLHVVNTWRRLPSTRA